MKRFFGLTLFASACGLALLASAQEPQGKKEDKPAEKKDAGQGENSPDRVKEIISRLDENYGKATDRLEKKDPGKDTREIQDQIIKDLDELIKQKQNNQNNSSSSSRSSQQSQNSSDSSSDSSSSGQSSQQNSKSGQGQKNNPSALNDQQKKNQGGGSKEQQKKDEGLAKKGSGKEQQDKKDEQAKAGSEPKGKEGKGGGGEGAKKKDEERKDKNTIADLYKEIWGHLPARDRSKMDVYSRERFMPRYEDLLRQYYRTIAEQGKRNEGD